MCRIPYDFTQRFTWSWLYYLSRKNAITSVVLEFLTLSKLLSWEICFVKFAIAWLKLRDYWKEPRGAEVVQELEPEGKLRKDSQKGGQEYEDKKPRQDSIHYF